MILKYDVHDSRPGGSASLRTTVYKEKHSAEQNFPFASPHVGAWEADGAARPHGSCYLLQTR